MKNNRRNFLKTSSLGILSLAIPFPLLGSNNKKILFNNVTNYSQAKEIAKKAKKYFYKKEYLKAEGFYRKCVELVPTDVRFYDNLKAVYGAQGKYTESINLFTSGLSQNPNNLVFHDRTARSLMQLELGNKKEALLYKNGNTESLLKEARKIYKQALKISPEKKYLSIGLEKVKRKLKEQDQQIDHRANKDYKKNKKKRGLEHKKRFNKYSIQELENQLEKLNSKKRTDLFIGSDVENRNTACLKEKILILTLLERKYRKQGDFSSAINTSLNWHNLAPLDSQAIKKLQRLYLKTSDYQGLITFKRSRVNKTPNVWSYLGLIKAIQIGHRKGLNVSLEEITSICNDLLSAKWRVTGSLKVTILDIKAKNFLKLNKKNKAKQVYERILKNQDIKSVGVLNGVINGYAISLLKKNEYKASENVLKFSLDRDNKITIDQIPNFISNKVEVINTSKKQDLLPLYYTLFRVYNKQNFDDKKRSVLNQILAIDSQNKFALKRS
jgi:tetratricopeptide (TPR) repeat protein